MLQRVTLRRSDIIVPIFVREGQKGRQEVPSMPGVFQMRVREIVEETARAYDSGIRAVLLFGLPERKDAIGSASWDPSGPVQSAIEGIKRSIPQMTVMADVCLCEYTDHGHCGVVEKQDVDNDATLPLLARQAVSFAQAGADFVAPSDMMDGRVAAIRRALDDARLGSVGIMAYSAKSAPQFGDRRTYQMDPANGREALHEIALDVEEGADIVMVKPALAYLDVIRGARERFPLPIAAYNVSGEYSMVKAAAERGWIDGPRVMNEILTAIKRAGADLIITYHAMEFAKSR